MFQNHESVSIHMSGSSGSSSESGPLVVHCSPGTGRTGTVIACDIAIRDFELTRNVDIPKIVYKVRRDRASAVQTKEQYSFIYKVMDGSFFSLRFAPFFMLFHNVPRCITRNFLHLRPF